MEDFNKVNYIEEKLIPPIDGLWKRACASIYNVCGWPTYFSMACPFSKSLWPAVYPVFMCFFRPDTPL